MCIEGLRSPVIAFDCGDGYHSSRGLFVAMTVTVVVVVSSGGGFVGVCRCSGVAS